MDPPITPEQNTELFVITTAMKRDRGDWQSEIEEFGLDGTVDSWNKIVDYVKKKDCFFIFDEQKAVGYGTWARTFIKIARKNRWIMLSATPADRWIDTMPIFVANGYYKHKTHFVQNHVMYDPFTKFPKIKRYLNTERLQRLKDRTFVTMPDTRKTKRHIQTIFVSYDKEAVNHVETREWNPIEDKPITNLVEYLLMIRLYLNSDPSRIEAAIEIQKKHHRLIVFYNFNYELDILRKGFGYTTVAEHNGHKHEPVPSTKEWVYLVQYLSGNEAWETTATDAMLFYSLNYSYRITKQARGRIDRLTTPHEELYYYQLVSKHWLDSAILKALSKKKNFNVRSLGLS
jgi:hypothetical protein